MPRVVRYRCSIRQFLNRPGYHGKAAIIASVENTSRLDEEELRYVRPAAVYLNISDCDKDVTLQFDIETRDEQANSMYKINTLLGALVRFQNALVDEIQLYNKRQAARRPRLQRRRPKVRPTAVTVPDGARTDLEEVEWLPVTTEAVDTADETGGRLSETRHQ